ncbi:thermonuclease family protein [Ectopseudomonas mendocina]|uniref:Thermonuclease family protein n=1 Tax=Ectopseudomonas mendocina TaxID=300 RepID=A0ABZ2RE57_ECTME
MRAASESPKGYAERMKKASQVGAFFVSALFTLSANAFCPVPGKLPQVEVQRVVDGDTLRLKDGRNVRLIGINTPELGRQGRTAEPFAEAARRRLQALVDASDGRVALQVGQESKDRYGRTLAHAYDKSGRNLEAQLLAEGLGFLVAVAPNLDLVSCQQSAERAARDERAGLWRQINVLSPGDIRTGGFALIQGRVQRVDRNGGGVWLEMGDSLVLHISRQDLRNFDLAELNALKGQNVEARGWVIDRAQRGKVRDGQARWLLPLTGDVMLQRLP